MRRRGGFPLPAPRKRAARRAVLLGALAAGLATGCIGLVRGDYYSGRSSGDLEACVPFTFDVAIEEGGRIVGLAATTYPWGTASWDVVGTITDLDVLLETRTEDPRVAERRLRWRGRRHAISLEVTEEGSRGCPAPRSVTLYRK
jgi:hypothetical protein